MKRPKETMLSHGTTGSLETDVAGSSRRANRSERGASLTEALVATFILGVTLSIFAMIEPAATVLTEPSGSIPTVPSTTDHFLRAIERFEAAEAERLTRGDEKPLLRPDAPADPVVFFSEEAGDPAWRRVRLVQADREVVVLSETRVVMNGPPPSAASRPIPDLESPPSAVVALSD